MDFMIPSWALGVGVIIIAVSIARAVSAGLGLGGVGRRGRLQAAKDDVTGEVTELRQTVDTLQHRLAEVEERLDFAERLLSKPPR